MRTIIKTHLDLLPERFIEILDRFFKELFTRKPHSLWIYIPAHLPFSTYPDEIKNYLADFIANSMLGLNEFSKFRSVHVVFKGDLSDIEHFSIYPSREDNSKIFWL